MLFHYIGRTALSESQPLCQHWIAREKISLANVILNFVAYFYLFVVHRRAQHPKPHGTNCAHAAARFQSFARKVSHEWVLYVGCFEFSSYFHSYCFMFSHILECVWSTMHARRLLEQLWKYQFAGAILICVSLIRSTDDAMTKTKMGKNNGKVCNKNL